MLFMTEEEIKALQEEKQEFENKYNELLTSVETLKGESGKAKEDLNKVVEELKEERRKKQEALDKASINNGEPVDVEQLVTEALTKKEQERRRQEVEQAMTEFKSSKPEFQSDPSGLVYSKFEQVLSRFNLSDITSKEEAKARLDEIYKFAKFKGEVPQDDVPSYEGTPSTGSSAPGSADPKEREIEELIKGTKVSKERYSELKQKYGDAFESLGIS